MADPNTPDERGLSDALRAAVDDTLSSLGEAGGAGVEAGAARAGELLDEVARRGREAGAEALRGGERLIGAIADTLRTGGNSKPKVESEPDE